MNYLNVIFEIVAKYHYIQPTGHFRIMEIICHSDARKKIFLWEDEHQDSLCKRGQR